MAKQNHSVSGAKSVDCNNTQCTSDTSLTSNKDGQPSDGHSRSCSQQSPAETPTLNIEIDDGVPADIAALVPVWLKDVMSWLLNQPRPADLAGQQPRFTEKKYSVAMDAWNHGLSSRKTGVGWVCLGVSNLLVLETRPKTIVVETDTETATKARWVFLLSQSFRPESYTDKENFRHDEMLHYQLLWLEQHQSGVYEQVEKLLVERSEAERMERYRQQFPTKRALYFERRRKNSISKVPAWYAAKYPDSPILQGPHEITGASSSTPPTYSPPPAPLPPVVTTTPLPAPPTPELTKHQEEVIRHHRLMWDFIESGMGSESTCSVAESCEDHDM